MFFLENVPQLQTKVLFICCSFTANKGYITEMIWIFLQVSEFICQRYQSVSITQFLFALKATNTANTVAISAAGKYGSKH